VIPPPDKQVLTEIQRLWERANWDKVEGNLISRINWTD
jgi:hypothetical protein